MSRTKRAEKVLEALRKVIPEPETELRHENPYELLVAVMLSAQCTDARVNEVTPAFYSAFPSVHDLSIVEPDDVFKIISSITYPNSKSRHLVRAARSIVEDFDGRVPSTVDELQLLPGVGRKTAQVVASVAFGRPTLAVDTHIFRVANRIGLVREDAATPTKVERQLKRIVPKNRWGEAHHLLILHGRYTCTARSPSCDSCVAAQWCKTYERIERLPDPLEGLEPDRGRFYCKTRRHYFDDPDRMTDRHGTEQISCPRCGSMNVFRAKSGVSTKRVRDYRV